MSKVNKLFKSPNLFFRDYFLKKAPLNYVENIKPLPAEIPSASKKSKPEVSANSKKKQESSIAFEQMIEDPLSHYLSD